ncbi:MAG: peptidase S8 [Ideonella sp. MAG2]|nr:MAG: peptidase S8 [Ideonella sp. MAG2]
MSAPASLFYKDALMSSWNQMRRPSQPQHASRRLPGLALALCAIAGAAAQAASAGELPFAGHQAAVSSAAPTDRLIVRYRDASELEQRAGRTLRLAKAVDTSVLQQRSAQLNQLVQGQGLKLRLLRQTGTGAHIYKLNKTLPTAEVARIAGQLMANHPAIELVEVDRKVFPFSSPNDPLYAKQWGLSAEAGGIRAEAAWARATGTGVVVAVLDSGIRPHVDFEGQTVPGYDFINDLTVANDGDGRDADASDPGDSNGRPCPGDDILFGSSWHGTHVSGIVAAKANNATGVVGAAFNAKIQPVRVLGVCGGYTSDIADAVIWASGGTVPSVPANATPAKVLNLSLGGYGTCETQMQEALDQAKARGSVVVIAAGNDTVDVSRITPASCNGVVAVAATGRYGARASYTNYGSLITLAAPGGDFVNSLDETILSTYNDGYVTPGADSYAFRQGTSMATPFVSGVAALMFSANPKATPDQIIATLKSSARPFPDTCDQCGAGLLDAQAAVQQIAPWMNEVEPNGTRAKANAVTAPGQMRGVLAKATDRDIFRVDLPPGKTLTGRLAPLTAGSGATLQVQDTVGEMASANGLGQTAATDFTYHNNGTSTKTLYLFVQTARIEVNTPYSLDLSW